MSAIIPIPKIFYCIKRNTLRPRQTGRYFCRRQFQMHFLEWKSPYFNSHFPRAQLIMMHHWFRWWLGPEQATSHYLSQWWSVSLTHICVTRPQWVSKVTNDCLGFRFIRAVTDFTWSMHSWTPYKWRQQSACLVHYSDVRLYHVNPHDLPVWLGL